MKSRLDARLRRLEAEDPEQVWRYQQGLAALLARVRQSPTEAYDLDSVLDETELVGLAKLLWETQQTQCGVHEEQRPGRRQSPRPATQHQHKESPGEGHGQYPSPGLSAYQATLLSPTIL